MKKLLLYIETLRRGGAERVMSEIANYFSEKYEVILVTNINDDSTVKQYNVNNNIKRYYLDELHRYTKNPIHKNIQRISELRKICKKEQPNVGVSFLGNGNIRFLFATRRLSMRKMVSVRNDPKKEYRHKELLAKVLFKKADGVVFQTEDAKKWFPKSVQKKSKVILNPVNELFFDTEWKPANEKYIVTTGRLTKQKNHELLIKAFAIFHKEFPNVKLFIYGSDFASGKQSRKSELETLIKDFQLEDFVFLPGNTENVCKVLSEASCFVLSSDYEGLPNALMEALAVGLPCISTDCPCGGPNSLIENGKNGILVPVGAEKTLSDELIKIFKNETYTKSLALSAKHHAQEFARETVMDKWEDFLFN